MRSLASASLEQVLQHLVKLLCMLSLHRLVVHQQTQVALQKRRVHIRLLAQQVDIRKALLGVYGEEVHDKSRNNDWRVPELLYVRGLKQTPQVLLQLELDGL